MRGVWRDVAGLTTWRGSGALARLSGRAEWRGARAPRGRECPFRDRSGCAPARDRPRRRHRQLGVPPSLTRLDAGCPAGSPADRGLPPGQVHVVRDVCRRLGPRQLCRGRAGAGHPPASASGGAEPRSRNGFSTSPSSRASATCSPTRLSGRPGLRDDPRDCREQEYLVVPAGATLIGKI